MFLPRDNIALVGGGSIHRRAHGGLRARTSIPPLAVEPGSNHEKILGRYWKSQKTRKIMVDPAELHPVSETAKLRTGAVVENVAVLATSKRTGGPAKAVANQSVDAADRRHDLASKWVSQMSRIRRLATPPLQDRPGSRRRWAVSSTIYGRQRVTASTPSTPSARPRSRTARRRRAGSGSLQNPR